MSRRIVSLLLFAAFFALSAVPPFFADDKKDDGFEPMFNGKDLSGWVNVNLLHRALFSSRTARSSSPANRPAIYGPRNSTRTSSRSSTGSIFPPSPARLATAASLSARSATRRRHRLSPASKCRCSSISPTRTRRAKSRPPVRATCSASGEPPAFLIGHIPKAGRGVCRLQTIARAKTSGIIIASKRTMASSSWRSMATLFLA